MILSNSISQIGLLKQVPNGAEEAVACRVYHIGRVVSMMDITKRWIVRRKGGMGSHLFPVERYSSWPAISANKHPTGNLYLILWQDII